MQVVSGQAMRRAESEAFAGGADPRGLMQQAGEGMAEIIRRLRPHPQRCALFVGKGHNGGDVLVAGAVLARLGWQIRVVATAEPSQMAELTRNHLLALLGRDGVEVSSGPGEAQVVLDGLLGIGAAGPLRGAVRLAADMIHSCRARGAWIVAADIPSGLDADTGVPAEGCVVADLTVTMGFPKAGLVCDAAAGHVGALEIVPLSGIPAPADAPQAWVSTPGWLSPMLPRRALDAHKGSCGRLGIVAGSFGMTGAASLASLGALRAGAGLVTVFVDPAIHPVVAAQSPPEAMVRPVAELAPAVLDTELDALALGPGVGFARETDLLHLITEFPGRMVVDADALTILSRHPEILAQAKGPRLLTPHPGEMERLLPRRAGWRREEWARAWTNSHKATLLLKGARTLIAESGEIPVFNSTGNPGMASGGMGDVLTGLCGALLAQGLTPHRAACLGAWLHGRAADRWVHGGRTAEESLLASDVAQELGAAFQDLRSASRSLEDPGQDPSGE